MLPSYSHSVRIFHHHSHIRHEFSSENSKLYTVLTTLKLTRLTNNTKHYRQNRWREVQGDWTNTGRGQPIGKNPHQETEQTTATTNANDRNEMKKLHQTTDNVHYCNGRRVI